MKKLTLFKTNSLDSVKKIFRSKKIWIIAAFAVIIAIIVFLTFGSDKSADKAEVVTADVTRGNIDKIIEGTGQIQAINQYEITSLAKGDIIADHFEEGDYVKKGQLLYEIDSESAKSSIQKAQSSVEKAQMNYEQAYDAVANLNVKSDISGVITAINVKKGDMVGNNTVIASVIDKENLLLKITFNEQDAKNLYIGQSTQVYLENDSTPVSGTVSKISTGSVVNGYGVNVTNVEIDVKNPGALVPGDKATVIAGDYACNDAGVFEYKYESQIVAETSGKVVSVNFSQGDIISKNESIVTLESKSATMNEKSNRLSLNDARQSLKDAQDVLEDYRITAPSDGKVVEKTAKAGEKLDQNSSSVMAIIADLSTLTFEMSIDELDINKIKVGQKVNVEADAIENVVFEGEVTNIKYTGTATQGVTSYPVTVAIKDGENSGLIPGMNVTGSVIVESVENVIKVPASAVRRGNMVIVSDDGKSKPVTSSAKNNGISDDEEDKQKKRLENMKSQLDVPDGYTVTVVETGLSDGTFIEIKRGLSEGQTVILPDVTNTSQNQQQGMQGGFGAMSGGGMPGGGMPGGGMTGGGMSAGNRTQGGMRQ